MYVTQKLKQDGYGDGKKVPSGRVKELENEYETAIPNDTNRFGVPLDMSFGDYIKNSFKRDPDKPFFRIDPNSDFAKSFGIGEIYGDK